MNAQAPNSRHSAPIFSSSSRVNTFPHGLDGVHTTMPRVFYATGHFRNGVLLAPLTAVVVADLVLEERRDPALALTAPDRIG